MQMATDLRRQYKTEIANLSTEIENCKAQLKHKHNKALEDLQLEAAAADALHREDLLALRWVWRYIMT